MQQPFPKIASLVHWHGRSATIGVLEDGMAATLAHNFEAVPTEQGNHTFSRDRRWLRYQTLTRILDASISR